MRVFFENDSELCIDNEVTRWHADHGWIWNVADLKTGEYLGVFFCTLLCGDGCVCHFSVKKGVKVSAAAVLDAFRKGIGIAAHYSDLLLAFVPEKKQKLIRILLRMGFRRTDCGYVRDGQKIAVLKFFAG